MAGGGKGGEFPEILHEALLVLLPVPGEEDELREAKNAAENRDGAERGLDDAFGVPGGRVAESRQPC